MKKQALTPAERKRRSRKKNKASISATEQVKYNSTMKKTKEKTSKYCWISSTTRQT